MQFQERNALFSHRTVINFESRSGLASFANPIVRFVGVVSIASKVEDIPMKNAHVPWYKRASSAELYFRPIERAARETDA